MRIFRFGELFCGPGGLSLGALRAVVRDKKGEVYKLEHAFATDIDPVACRTYRENICRSNGKNVYDCDIKELDLNKLPDIDALAFGFPCNDFSIVGEQKGVEGEYGALYKYGLHVLEAKRPQWFLAENVSGLESADKGKAFEKILRDLDEAGYELTPHLYKFEEYGVPQRRHRIIIVGIDKNEELKFRVPYPTTKDHYMSAKKAIEDPPIPKDACNNEYTKHKKTVIERLSYIPEGKNAWCKELPEHLRLNVKGAFLSHIYKRLSRNEPAYTVTGSGGGGTHVYHWEENRALTNRERARLQSFPDDFIFIGGKEDVRKQIGMAVPPVGAQIIVEAILKTFAEIEYDSVDAHWEEALDKCQEER